MMLRNTRENSSAVNNISKSKKKLAVIAGIVYPNPSATGRVVLDYIEPLKDKYDISIIYLSDTLEDKYEHEEKGIHYYPCCNWRFSFEQRCRKSKTRLAKTGIILSKILGRIQTKLLFPNNLRWFSKSAYQVLSKINGIDLLFSVSSPFAAHLAAEKYKKDNPSTKWISYTVDPYSSKLHLFPIGISFSKAVKKELQCLKNADIRFMSAELISHRTDLSSKLHFTELPYMLAFQNSEYEIIENLPKLGMRGKINLIYAGSFYEIDRNPKVMLETISKLAGRGVVLHIFSRGSCLELIKEYSERENSNIFLYEPVGRRILLQYYQQADALVNIANKNPESSPSKIFEYIAIGKPIIEFGNEGGEGYLARYPLALILSDTTEKKEQSVLEFLEESKDRFLSRNEIEKIYEKHSPQKVIESLEEMMDS